MKEVENVLRIFKETKKALAKKDSATIKSLSNQTINTASLTHDPDNIAVAVIIYSLSKIVERGDYLQLGGWENFYKLCVSSIDNIILGLNKNDEAKVSENLKLIRKNIGSLSGKLKDYISEVFRKASINKASKIYEHGISMEKTAGLLGITMFELAGYAGQQNIPETSENRTMSIQSRIKMVMEFFR